jgi:hypothetical protein
MGTYNELFGLNPSDIALIEYAGPNQRRLASTAASECPGRTRRKRGCNRFSQNRQPSTAECSFVTLA